MIDLIYPQRAESLMVKIYGELVNPCFKLNNNLGWFVYQRMLNQIRKNILKVKTSDNDG